MFLYSENKMSKRSECSANTKHDGERNKCENVQEAARTL